MKNGLLYLCAFLLSVGCVDNPVNKKVKEAKQNVSNAKKAADKMQDIQDDMKKLQEMEPLSNDVLKAWLPDQIGDMKRTSYKAGHMSMMQISSIEATYENDDKTKKFKMELLDGAGPTGYATTATFQLMFTQDFEEESETKLRRSSERDGIKVIEEYYKDRNNSTIEQFHAGRFYLKGKGTNMDLDETWKAIKYLEVEDLE